MPNKSKSSPEEKAKKVSAKKQRSRRRPSYARRRQGQYNALVRQPSRVNLDNHAMPMTQRPQNQTIQSPSLQMESLASQQMMSSANYDTTIVQHLLAQTTDPLTSPLVRLAEDTNMASQGTALAKLFSSVDVNWTNPVLTKRPPVIPTQVAPGGTGSLVKPMLQELGNFPVILTRHPVVAAIHRSDFPTTAAIGDTARYDIRWHNDSTNFLIGHTMTTALPVTYLEHASGHKLYGDWYPACNINNNRCFWADAAGAATLADDTEVTMEFTTTSSTAVDITVVFFDNRPTGKLAVNNFDINVSSATPVTRVQPISWSSYWSIEFAAKANNVALSVRAYVDVRCSFGMRHVVLTDRQTMANTIQRARVNGASLLLTNRSPEIVKGGLVYAAQMPSNLPWFRQFDTPERISNINPNMRHVNGWEDGFYGFIKPQGGPDGGSPFAFIDTTEPPQDEAVDELYNFDPYSVGGYLVAIISPPENSPDVEFPTSTALITIVHALEYSTTSQLLDVRPSRVLTKQHDEYVDALRAMPQFYENPFHISDIWSHIKAATQRVIYFADHAIKGANIAKMLGTAVLSIPAFL